MKKLMILTGLLFCMASCKNGGSSGGGSADNTNNLASLQAAAGPDFEIDSATAHLYVSDYTPYAGVAVTEAGKKSPNTETVWLSLARLQYLVAKLDSEKSAYGTDGLRIYFARYPKNDPDSIADRNTLVFISTKSAKNQNGDSIHLDYYTESKSGVKKGLGTPPENKGEICPPPAQCCTVGATLLCN